MYEKLPRICFGCGKVGHQLARCLGWGKSSHEAINDKAESNMIADSNSARVDDEDNLAPIYGAWIQVSNQRRQTKNLGSLGQKVEDDPNSKQQKVAKGKSGFGNNQATPVTANSSLTRGSKDIINHMLSSPVTNKETKSKS